MEKLLEDEVYHYHHKLILKEAELVGLGLASGLRVLVRQRLSVSGYGQLSDAIDPRREENGCLQVVEKSHLLGRMDHGKWRSNRCRSRTSLLRRSIDCRWFTAN